jgi:hypothetical protein
MIRSNFIVMYSGAATPDAEETRRILDSCGAALVDDSMFPNAVLVELDEQMVSRLQAELKGDWTIQPEKKFRVPDTRRKPR